ncbi:gamma-glutamylcyclotransferase family protein [Siphonobacter aquaeclarae]|uniref:Uncharacterized conserved protein YtfP, gamma-glutamylcyclotransferase (GGCT)/AIG2-like family n=1 Tax=Siphonobacter aquaeclarae TaxID=563176 RepID=A0A1G9TCA9_9BACT|nr:gamma-glutamylcyclotransferase family protein [Siphonobacter aquaeclarae]SDM45270.1 Uncharacterized conserved protein YtfP, gamma-glutamylcyclotransferase (GGCT)/AIG2-like family [Siphonobacter aquaeclarae]
MTTYYFSYGSYMSPEKMKASIPSARLIGTGRLNGYRLVFTAYSELRSRVGADILPADGETVWGIVYEIPQESLAEMDRNKAYPVLYDRLEVDTQVDGKPVRAWTYALVDKTDSNHPPDAAYLKLLADLTRVHGFPESYLESFRH